MAVIVFRSMICATQKGLFLYLVLLLFFKMCTNVRIVEGRPPASVTNQQGLSKDIVFPNSQESEGGDLYAALSPQCSNQTFCESVSQYPEGLFYNILKSETYRSRYQQYFENLAYNEELIYSRSNKNSEYLICPSKKSIVFPKVAFNVKKELKFIYNLDSYKQGVSINTCVKKSKCKFYDKMRNFRTRCKQLFVEKLLLTADSNGKPYVDRYKFPSACVCAYRNERSHLRFSRLYKYK